MSMEFGQRILNWVWELFRSWWSWWRKAPVPPRLKSSKEESEALDDERSPLLCLPLEIQEYILLFLDAKSMWAFGSTCSTIKTLLINTVTDLSGDLTEASMSKHFVLCTRFKSENRPKIWDLSLLNLELLTQLSLIDCGNISDVSLERKIHLVHLEIVGASEITGATLNAPNLEFLSLERNWTFRGQYLQRFTRLKQLNLQCNRLVEASHLSKLTQLWSLNLAENDCIQNGEFFAFLTNVTELNLMCNSHIQDSDLQHLSLQSLNLWSNTLISGDMMENSIESLRNLSLRNNFTFSNSNLEFFENLEHVDLTHNQRIDRGFFEEMRPNLRIK